MKIEMDMCPNQCGQPLVQYNANEYYCKICKRWFDLDEVLLFQQQSNPKAHFLPIDIEFYGRSGDIQMVAVKVGNSFVAMEQKDWLDFARGVIRKIETHTKKAR